MPRNHIMYGQQDHKKFNHVTLVKTGTALKWSTCDDLSILINNINDITHELVNDVVVSEGRSKCSPEDTYDEKRGLVIASRKAELKGTKAFLKSTTNLRKELEKALKFVEEIEDQLDYKAGKLALELVASRRGN